VPDGLPGILGHQGFELAFGPFVVEKGAPGVAEERRELRPVPVTSAQLRMARAALNWTVRDLAAATGLHRNTITNIEVGRYAGDETSLAVIERVLTKAGVEFLDENGGGPGVRLRKTQQGGKRKYR
jgi:DNA-binding XRE family transcriptional regulator